MSDRRVPALLVGALLAPALISCSGEETPDRSAVPAYFEGLESLTHQLDRDNTEADEELAAELEEAAPRDLGDIFARVTTEAAGRLEGVIAEMGSLTPPEEAVAAHDELVEATSAMVAEDRLTAESLAGLTASELESIDPRPAYRAAEQRVDAACAAVQSLADEAGADVSLCVGMFAPPG